MLRFFSLFLASRFSGRRGCGGAGFFSTLCAAAALSLASCSSDAGAGVAQVSSAARETARLRSVSIGYTSSDRVQGSGVLWSGDGSILTCLHVIQAREDVLRVSFDGGRSYTQAEVVYAEPRFDLALLRVRNPDQVPPDRRALGAPALRDRAGLEDGQHAFAYGAPYALANSFLFGYISHVDRREADVSFQKVPFIQTMNLSFPGVSGAGVYLTNGELIGINRATFGIAAGNGIGLVIPAGFAEAFLQLAVAENAALHESY